VALCSGCPWCGGSVLDVTRNPENLVDHVLGRSSGSIWLLPLRDLLSFAVFLGSFAGRSVRWRDDSFRVAKSGTMSQS
jgi:hypothetical protein